MSDESVRAALRSMASVVLVEAPAGCGKTFLGAEYAREIAAQTSRALILTHTHAACSVFAERTRASGARVDIRTIDSIIGQIAAAYRIGLGLPEDIASWIRQQEDGYVRLAEKVSELLERHPAIAASLASRHPVVICDEYQDSSRAQHAVIMSVKRHGSRVRIFADPMQRIFRDVARKEPPPSDGWRDLIEEADAFEGLDTAHRWASGCTNLGSWTLQARTALKDARPIDLRSNLPPSVRVVFAENIAPRALEYQLSPRDRREIDAFSERHSELLVLTHHNRTARSLRGFFNRRIPLWEGHTRYGLEQLADCLRGSSGDERAVAAAVVTFMGEVAKGFSRSAFGDCLTQEAVEGCTKPRRGKPGAIQALARIIVAEPDHHGVSKMLRRIAELKQTDSSFRAIEIDYQKEFWEAVRLGQFETVDEGLREIAQRRSYTRPKPPDKAISTIHKAKGLECSGAILIPCDSKSFPATDAARCLLYVALSRAKRELMIVVSRDDPSPLLTL